MCGNQNENPESRGTGCICYQLLHNKLSQNFAALKGGTFTIPQFLWVRHLATTQPGPLFQSLSQAAVKVCWLGCGPLAVHPRRVCCCQVHGVLAGPSSSLAVGQGPPSVLYRVGLAGMAGCFIRVIKPKWQSRQSARKTEVTVFWSWSVIIHGTSHHLCHVLLVRSKSLGSATLKGRGLRKGPNTRRWKSLRVGLGLPPHSRQSSRPNATLDVLQCWW